MRNEVMMPGAHSRPFGYWTKSNQKKVAS